MKVQLFFCLLLLVVSNNVIASGMASKKGRAQPIRPSVVSNTNASSSNNGSPLGRAFARVAIERQAKALAKEGRYEEAIMKYEEAMAPEFLNSEHSKGKAMGGITDIYVKQAKYAEALEHLQWHLDANPKKYEYEKLGIEALIKARDLQSDQPIYDYIRYLKETHKKALPPKTYVSGSADYTTPIIRFYNHIGDADGGIEFVNGVIKYFGPGDCLAKRKYIEIREAFLEDKKEGFKGCRDTKPGDICMGRATKALVDSDYFYW